MAQDGFRASEKTRIVIDGRAYERSFVSVRPAKAASGPRADVFALIAFGPEIRPGDELRNVEVLTTNGNGFLFPHLRVVVAETTSLGLSFDAQTRGPFLEWCFQTSRARPWAE